MGVLMKQTVHVECVCLLSKRLEARNHIDVKVDMNEIDVTSAEKKQLANRLRNNNLATINYLDGIEDNRDELMVAEKGNYIVKKDGDL